MELSVLAANKATGVDLNLYTSQGPYYCAICGRETWYDCANWQWFHVEPKLTEGMPGSVYASLVRNSRVGGCRLPTMAEWPQFPYCSLEEQA